MTIAFFATCALVGIALIYRGQLPEEQRDADPLSFNRLALAFVGVFASVCLIIFFSFL